MSRSTDSTAAYVSKTIPTVATIPPHRNMLTQSQERSTITKPLDPARLRESVKQEAGQFSKTQNLLCEFVEELMLRVDKLEAEKLERDTGLKS